MQHFDASEYLEIDIPAYLMIEQECGGYGPIVARINELRPEETADYIIADPTSEIAQHFSDDIGVDITDRADIMSACDIINTRMADRID